MKKILLIAAAVLMALAPLCAQTRKDIRSAKKDAAAAARQIKRDGYKPIELGNAEPRLERYFLKVYDGCQEITGESGNCISVNLAKVTALANAAGEYVQREGGMVRERIVKSASNLTEEQIDNIVASFEQAVQKEIKGELVPYLTCIRTRRNLHSARVYCIVDVMAAAQARRRALQLALEQQTLAQQYGAMVSDWIDEGFGEDSVGDYRQANG